MIKGVPVYWILYVAGAIQLYATLRFLGRVREWHHGYFALALGLLPWWPVRIAALAILADELFLNHIPQELALRDGRKAPPDRSPLHRLYVWAYRKVFVRG